MNIPFQALAIFALALPGIAFLRAFSTAGALRLRRAFVDELAWGIVSAVGVHAAMVPLANSLCPCIGLAVDLEHAAMLAMGEYGKDDVHLEAAIRSVTRHPVPVLAYFLTATVLAWLAGRFVRGLRLRRGWLDGIDDEPNARKFEHWLGSLKMDDARDAQILPLFVTVVDFADGSYLVAGTLADVVPNPDDGTPDRFELVNVSRRRFEDEEAEFVPVPGDNFIVRASESKTINVQIVAIEGVPFDGDEQEPPPAG